MSWDAKRAGGPTYFYRSVREGGRGRKIYLGRGPEAKDQAPRDEEERAARAADSSQIRASRERVGRAVVATRAFRAAVALITEASLLAVGVRLHRGEIRRKRN